MKRKILLVILAVLLLLPTAGFTGDVETEPGPAKFKIFDIRRVPSADIDRIDKYDVLIMYEVDPRQRHIIRIPEEEFSEERMIQAIREDIASKSEFIGKEYEIE